VLIGDRGSGKTTMGRHLAEKFGICFIDLDDKITE
jgi:shikimate kinase